MDLIEYHSFSERLKCICFYQSNNFHFTT